MSTQSSQENMPIYGSTHSIAEVYKLGTFEPARVQREYQWGEKECSDLFRDVFEAFQNATGFELEVDAGSVATAGAVEATAELTSLDSSWPNSTLPEPGLPKRPTVTLPPRPHPATYFLGHMVLMPRRQKSDGYFVFDGQQRLTTLAILLSVIRDRISETAAELEAILLFENEPRLTVSSPGGSLKWIMAHSGGSRRRVNQGAAVDRRIAGAAAVFHDRLSQLAPEAVKDLLGFLLTRVFITVTFVTNIRQAQIMFETANSRGKSLSPVDILKGHVIREIEAYIPGRAVEVERVWDKSRQDMGEQFPDFVRAIDFTWFRQARTESISDELLELFDGEDGAKRAVDFVLRDFVAFREGFKPIARWTTHDDGMGVGLALRRLSFLPWKEWQAVAMAVLVKYPLGHPRAVTHMDHLVTASYIMCLLGWSEWPDRRWKAFGRALDQIQRGDNPFASGKALTFRTDRRIQAKAALQAPVSAPAIGRPLMLWLETLLWPEPVPREATHAMTLEHVLPRAHGADWEGSFPDENDRETCKNLIGNFCLIPYAMNMELGNSGWLEKRKAYRALAKTFKSAHDVASEERWHAGIVRRRTARLAEQCSRALGLE